MATTIQSLAIKTVEQIRDDYLRTYRNALINRGIANPDVSEGTEIYGKALSLAQQIYGASVAVPLAADAQMPDSAQGDDLVRICKPYGLALRPAGPSSGPLVLTASIATPLAVVQGAQLIDPNGLIYEVATGGSYTPGGAPVPIVSVATGSATQLTAGTVLRWVQPPAYATQTALVGAGGLTGGTDAETYEGLRARLLDRLQNPPNGDNWASLVADAEDSATAVQKAFAYQACNGPSTEHVAVVGAATATSKSRAVDGLVTMPTVVVPSVLAARPFYVETIVTTTQDYPFDLSIGLSLPASQLASPQGPGGGWTDGNPFPMPSASAGYTVNGAPTAATVTAVTSSTAFAVTSGVAPVIGSQICWVSRDDWQLRTAKVLSAGTVGGGIWTITIDTPFVSATSSASLSRWATTSSRTRSTCRPTSPPTSPASRRWAPTRRPTWAGSSRARFVDPWPARRGRARSSGPSCATSPTPAPRSRTRSTSRRTPSQGPRRS